MHEALASILQYHINSAWCSILIILPLGRWRQEVHPGLHRKFKVSLSFLKKKKTKPSVMVYAHNLSAWQTEAAEMQF